MLRLPNSSWLTCPLLGWCVACGSSGSAGQPASTGATAGQGTGASAGTTSSGGTGAVAGTATTGGAGGGAGATSAGGSSSGSPSTGGSSGDGAGGDPSGGETAAAGAGTGGMPTTYPPGPPGCGLEQAAFCETFDAPSNAPTRAGELDGQRWSAARMCNIGGPSADDEAVAIGPATMPACRADLPDHVFPSADAVICDGNPAIESNHLLVLVAAQNYGQNSYRARQPFDFAGRTGKVVFDAEGNNVGLLGWISLELTEDPAPAPSFTLQQNFENGSIPRNGFEIQFSHNCGGDKVGIGAFLVYRDFGQTLMVENEGNCADAAAGKLNHFEIEIAQDQVAVYATPFSENGVDFGERVELASVVVDLPFSRGYLHFTTHNHATLKYSDDTVDAWAARWDNLGFDGPAITGGWREYEALDPLDPTKNGKVNVAWRIADEADGPSGTIEIPGVDPAGVKSARIALQNWSLHAAGDAPEPDFALNYRLNGGAWQQRKLSASELQMMVDLPNAGTRSLMLDVDVADLVAGTNALELTTSNAPQSYPPVALDIDLILRTE